jgi:YlmC/YmxH family sporulation protein
MKEVINIHDGARLGFVCDVEIETDTGKLCAIVVPGPGRFWIFSHDEPVVIPWECIRKIGDDIILVSFEIVRECDKEHKKWF